MVRMACRNAKLGRPGFGRDDGRRPVAVEIRRQTAVGGDDVRRARAAQFDRQPRRLADAQVAMVAVALEPKARLEQGDPPKSRLAQRDLAGMNPFGQSGRFGRLDAQQRRTGLVGEQNARRLMVGDHETCRGDRLGGERCRNQQHGEQAMEHC